MTKPRPSKLERERLLGTHHEAQRTNLTSASLDSHGHGTIVASHGRYRDGVEEGAGHVKRQASSAHPHPSLHTHTKRERPLPTNSNNGRRYTRHTMYSNPIDRRISHDPPLLAAYAFHGVVRVHRCIYRETSVRLAGSDLLDDFRVSRRERSRWFWRVRS